jgi:hypothetical protein
MERKIRIDCRKELKKIMKKCLGTALVIYIILSGKAHEK